MTFYSNILIIFVFKSSIDSGSVSGDAAETVLKMPELLEIVPVRGGSHSPIIMVDGELESASRYHSVVSKIIKVRLAGISIWSGKD